MLQGKTPKDSPKTSSEQASPEQSDARVQLKGRTLGDQLNMVRPPVQARGNVGTEGVHEAAGRGIAGGGGALPHSDRIQASFGGFDVSGISAHVGGAASDACKDMGASAYATGSSVAFKGAPDLHTAAHEAAHIVQQQAGVSLPGGVGAVGDRYEQHADKVADAVVAGRSAEPILSQMGGGASSIQRKATGPIQRAGEEPGAWLQQQTLTKDSFFDLIQQNLIAVDEWNGIASVVDPPPAWQSILATVGTIALAAALGGVGGVVAAKLISEGTKMIAQFAINAAIEGGKKAIETGVGAAVGSAGAGDGAGLRAFVANQKYGLNESSKRAREQFVVSSGTHTNQQLTMAQMRDIKRANDGSFASAKVHQQRQMLIGWMNMLAGTDNAKNSTDGLEDTSVKGVLGLVIRGSNDRANQIVRAETEGVNESLRGQITGTPLSNWIPRRGAGLNIRVRTAENGFTVSSATKDRLKAAGKWPSSMTTADQTGSIYFAAAIQPDGSTYMDTDADWKNDFNWGADAGRYFLNNIRTATDVINDLSGTRLPSVGT